MSRAEPTSSRGRPTRQTLIGTAVALWALADPVIAVVVIALAVLTRPLPVFVVAAVVLCVVNLAACRWLDRQWTVWASSYGERLEARLEKMRRGQVMRHPVKWITEGSAAWFVLAALFINVVLAVGVARLISGQPVPEGRTRTAAIVYSVFIAALYAAVGWAVGDNVQAG